MRRTGSTFEPRAVLPSILVALAVVVTAGATPVFAGGKIFRLEDPRGDDNGDGSMRYPLSYYGLAPGDLDIVSLEARRVSGGTEFELTLASPVRSPEGLTVDIGGSQLDDLARFGFYNLNFDLYIDMDRKPGSGGVQTLPGRHALIGTENAWERAVVLTPRPNEARSSLRRAMLANLREELKEAAEEERAEIEGLKESIPEVVERHTYFPNRIRVFGRSIRFFVPDEFLGGPAKAEWSYVAFTSGADIDQRFGLPQSLSGGAEQGLFILPVFPGGAADRFGGRRDDDRGQPPIVDLLVASGNSQKKILSDYDPRGTRLAELPGVVPAEQP